MFSFDKVPTYCCCLQDIVVAEQAARAQGLALPGARQSTAATPRVMAAPNSSRRDSSRRRPCIAKKQMFAFNWAFDAGETTTFTVAKLSVNCGQA
jgi:hypothetical protein